MIKFKLPGRRIFLSRVDPDVKIGKIDFAFIRYLNDDFTLHRSDFKLHELFVQIRSCIF